MTAEKETLRRVQDGLFHLQKGLAPFVEARMKASQGTNWLHYASRAQGSAPNAPLDAYGLVKTMLDNWRDVFDPAFGRNDRHKARSFTSMVLEARNAISHLAIGLQDDEALRYLDAMHQLLKLTKAVEKETTELRKLYDAQRNSGSRPAMAEAPPPGPVLNLSNGAAKALKPWIEVALPHPDVIANRFKEAEFAADLFAVDAGHASEGYATPLSFFGITFLTEGLKRVLTSAMQRLADTGGDPVIGLQTVFGGGKTHTMLAIYHLAKHLADGGDPRALPGLGEVVEKSGIGALPKPRVATFVGSADGPDISVKLDKGPRVHTPWGYLAYRLAGEKGLAIVEEAEKARTSPGSRAMLEVFGIAGPCVILLDELVTYARQLEDLRFDAFLSFIHSLTEAAKMSPRVLIVGSLPESDSEAGGERGKEALRRLEQVFGRVQSPWLPASGNETYEIIRRRLFQALDSEGEKARDETTKAFHDLYRKNAAEFPPEAKDARYLELLRLSYPIHPELFDRLSKDWASLERFQRTRGVLRFMANVIGVLWRERTGDPMITPALVPLAHERVRASVLYPLDAAFGAVVDREVDGDGSLPARIEANPTRRMSQLRAATRSARAVFLCTAPLVGQANAGLTGQGLRLACAQPGDQLAIFGEALRELSERATYLYEDGGRYWFSTQPTLNRLADDRAKEIPPHEADAAIVGILREDARTRSGFHRVHAAPDDPTSIDEAQSLALVILHPDSPHSRGVTNSRATEAATETLTRCRASQRRLRNTLLFVAADEPQLDTAREVMRRAMAWKSIVDDDRLKKQLTTGQVADAQDKARSNRDAAAKAVRSAWSHILHPEKSATAGKAFELELCLISGRERAAIPAAVYDKAKADGIVLEKLGPERLWLALEPIWPQDRPHLKVSEIADWFATYVYLPKLRDRVVLETAMRDSLAKLDPQFGYADGFDEATGNYRGLVWAKAPPMIVPPDALLVRADEAKRQLSEQPAAAPSSSAAPTTGAPTPHPGGGQVPSPTPTPPRKPRRFYGSVEIDMVRPVKAFDSILNAVVLELQKTSGAKVTLTLEISAEAADGFSENDAGIIRDNARQLRFKAESTGFDS